MFLYLDGNDREKPTHDVQPTLQARELTAFDIDLQQIQAGQPDALGDVLQRSNVGHTNTAMHAGISI